MTPGTLSSRRKRTALVAALLVAVTAVPLARNGGTHAGAVTISGARNLSDELVVQLQPTPPRTTDVHLLAFNDFHGNLEAGGLNLYGRFAGGAAYLAKLIKDRQAEYGTHQVTVMAGDNIGASPLANSLFFEEPATIVTNHMNVDWGSVGNHEFDKGRDELERIQHGGCKPVDGCTAAPYALVNGRTTNRFPGADFQYLSANVVDEDTGETLFPAFGISRVRTESGRRVRIGFIGEVLEATPTIVTPTGVAGLDFLDEADAANAAVERLKRRGVNAIVLVIHQGGFQSGTAAINGCEGNLAGSDIAEIATRLDPAVKVIVSGHTHAEYRCTVEFNGVTRLVTSASSFGRVLSDITLTLDDKTGEIVQMAAENVIVENALNSPGPGVTRIPDPSKEDPTVKAIVDQYVAAAAPLANRVIGTIQGDLLRTQNPLGESTLGNVIADAQLAATAPAGLGDAVIAFMNPGGIRSDLRTADVSSGGEPPGKVTYGEAFTVQPFGNSLVTKTMTGAQIHRVLQQQFIGCEGQTTKRILQISHTFSYEQDESAATCPEKIGRMFLNGVEVLPTDELRVTMNSFLAPGGDGFTVFREGTADLGGAVDIDALIEHFAAAEPNGGIAVPALGRIVAKPAGSTTTSTTTSTTPTSTTSSTTTTVPDSTTTTSTTSTSMPDAGTTTTTSAT
jgi:5'-nucleotidase